jgi:hypothetical protein
MLEVEAEGVLIAIEAEKRHAGAVHKRRTQVATIIAARRFDFDHRGA